MRESQRAQVTVSEHMINSQKRLEYKEKTPNIEVCLETLGAAYSRILMELYDERYNYY